ncbi:hypothetical protein [Wenyingzhuangia sp. IMCC45574]
MTTKDIEYLLANETGTILLKKESEKSFFESLLENWTSIISLIYYLKRRKYDYLILTNRRIIIIVRNKKSKEILIEGFTSCNYNGIKCELEINNSKGTITVPLKSLRINYEGGKLLRRKLRIEDI